MSITPPENLTYGTVVGRFMTTLLDSTDPDNLPDAGVPSGTVTFTPSVAYYKNLAVPATVLTVAATGTIGANGYLYGNQGGLGVALVATNNVALLPSGWTYAVQVVVGGRTLPSFNISVTGGSVQDLTTLVPDTGAGAALSSSDAARIAAEAAAIRAEAAAEAAGNASAPVDYSTAAPFTVFQHSAVDGVWPTVNGGLRPSPRADLVFIWRGTAPTPPTVASGDGGMHLHDLRFI